MKKAICLACALALLATGCLTTGSATQKAVVRAKNRVAPAMVHIRPVKETFSRGKREEFVVIGSGFIISPDGYVVTNAHVAGESNFVRCVLSDKQEVEAEVIGVDNYTDIALIKLKVDDQDLPYVKLGTSRDLEAGQTVLALGSPQGLARSVSLGIISVTDRYLGGRGEMVSPFNNWIQTDAAINPGNSGGPLVDLKGNVVGVNARMLRGAENVGFAIPIDIANEVVKQIKAHGRVKRSWLGLTLQEMRRKTDDPDQNGVIIADIDPLSPAYQAHLKPGDIMLSVNDIPINAQFIEDLPAARKMIADLVIGEEANILIKREDEEMEIKVATVEKMELRGTEVEFKKWGFTASELTQTVVRRAQLQAWKGIAVLGTQRGAPASNSGLQNGDIILKVDGHEIDNLATFEKVYKEVVESKKRLVLMDIKRGAVMPFILLKQENGGESEQGGDSDEK